MKHKALVLLAAVLAAACNPQRWLPEDQPWIRRIEITESGQARTEDKYLELLQLQTNTQVLGTYPYVALYQRGRQKPESRRGRWLQSIGEAPAIADSAKIAETVLQLERKLRQEGYFFARVRPAIEAGPRGTTLRFDLERGKATRLGTITPEVYAPAIEDRMTQIRMGSLLVPGMRLSRDMLESERKRVAEFLKENGFFTVGPEAVGFDLDTLGHPYRADGYWIIQNWIRDSEFGPQEEPHKPWYFGRVSLADSANYNLNERGIRRLHLLQPGDLYRASTVTQSQEWLRRLDAFQNQQWRLSPRGDSLDAELVLKPAPRIGMLWETEGTNTSGIYGLQSAVEVRDRNPFGGLEALSGKLAGGLGVAVGDTSSLFRTYFVELGVQLEVPDLVGLPNVRRNQARSSANFTLGRQYRREFDRLAVSGQLHYHWEAANRITWDVKPIYATYVDLRGVDSTFYAALASKSGFQDVLILGPRVSLKRPTLSDGRWSRRSEWAFETSGILTDLGFWAARGARTQPYTLAGVPYAHYVRAEADYRWRYRGRQRREGAVRLQGGYLHALANSPGLPPFERAFYAGGSNDLRSWINFRIGPGALPKAVFDTAGFLGSGTVKLLAQAEWRFPIAGSTFGALFADAGNVWLTSANARTAEWSVLDDPAVREAVAFNLLRLPRQTALGLGFGLRYDFDFFIARADWGFQVFDPRRTSTGDAWWRPSEGIRRSALQIAIGLPF
ncbi:MAG: BamA/TamA family outer membrane protein [Schleiferiaceae bacterium]